MNPKEFVMGLFRDETRTATVLEEIQGSPYELRRVHSPIPALRVAQVLRLKKSRAGYFTLAGSILGFCAGFGLAVFTATRWNLVVSGKPVVAWIPFVIVGFEFTILFAVLGNMLGFLTQARLPDWRGLDRYDPRCSGEHFGILASCEQGQEEELMRFFRERGGETVPFRDPGGRTPA